jgi:uncharacterized membrane protein
MDPRGSRLTSIDAVRGLVMILMALDHVRDFLHRDAMLFSPTDLTRTTPLLFFTRWITHFCAPVFMFTAGLGAFFWWQHGRTRAQLSRFLLTRGLWLIVLELTVMRAAYQFSLSMRHPVLLLVLWALGASMVGMAALVWLPLRMLAILSVVVIALHNCLDPIRAARFGSAAGWWNVLHEPGVFRIGTAVVVVGYPLIPWIAVMAAGFCCGPIFRMDPASRRRTLLTIGAAATAAFLVLRAINIYGDPVRWSGSLLSFLNTTKYPPSLEFLLMTLGPALLLLACFDRWTPGRNNPVVIFGRVPLFYYVLHFYAAHAVASLMAIVRYGRPALSFAFMPFPSTGGPRGLFPPDFGYPLWVVYVAWVLIVAGLYPVCRWFAGVKARRRDWWLSYL